MDSVAPLPFAETPVPFTFSVLPPGRAPLVSTANVLLMAVAPFKVLVPLATNAPATVVPELFTVTEPPLLVIAVLVFNKPFPMLLVETWAIPILLVAPFRLALPSTLVVLKAPPMLVAVIVPAPVLILVVPVTLVVPRTVFVELAKPILLLVLAPVPILLTDPAKVPMELLES